MPKRYYLLVTILLGVLLSGCSVKKSRSLGLFTTDAVVSANTKKCLQCHTQKHPAIVDQWQLSKHGEKGIGCYECHQAEQSDVDANNHYGVWVATLVTPKDCSKCHAREASEFLASHHARGGQILDSLDNYLGEVVEGYPASVSGCQQCHGSKVEVTEVTVRGRTRKTFSADTYPNFGIGRMNPDGSNGSCAACHSRHEFSLALARAPETCSRCHLGPDHPQKEVYEESKHNITYRAAGMEQMNMDSDRWVLGVDYTAAPTCATCHVSATSNQPVSHDIGNRVSWNLRAPVSFKTKDADRKRTAMQDVCMNCHASGYVKKFYTQLDAGVTHYNNKFAIPAGEIIKKLREAGKIDSTQFNDKIEWTYFFLWHHEGRRARTGLAMMGPDYVQWHGFYEIAERFYMELVHEAEELLPGVTDEILSRDEHKWFLGGMSDADRQKNLQNGRSLYGGNRK